MQIIRTTDRMNFKRCRQAWDFGSKMRQNYEPLTLPKALDFGTAFHYAMEVFYDPMTWDDRQVKEALAIKAFNDIIDKQRIKQLTVNGSQETELVVELEQDYHERLEMGLGMLKYYFYYSAENDNFKPIATEIEFEVPIPVPAGFRSSLANRFHEFSFVGLDGNLKWDHQPVVYQGRIDLLAQDEKGRYIIVDHKTAAQFGDLTWLALDEQCTSYGWAVEHSLGLDVSGILYNQVRKKAPQEPKLLKSGMLSENKSADTTAELFLSACTKLGQDPAIYSDYLDHLNNNGKEFVRRTFVRRTAREYETQTRRIFLEALEMIQQPLIYPNPSSMNCNGCMFLQPCLATQDGGDSQYFLKELYRKRK